MTWDTKAINDMAKALPISGKSAKVRGSGLERGLYCAYRSSLIPGRAAVREISATSAKQTFRARWVARLNLDRLGNQSHDVADCIQTAVRPSGRGFVVYGCSNQNAIVGH